MSKPRKISRGISFAAFGALLVTSRGAAATTVDIAYGEDTCRLAAWSTCPATGACPTISSFNGDGIYHLDNDKLEPEYPMASGLTSLTFMCPVSRGVFGGSGDKITVDVAGQAPAQKAQSLSCTLYHYNDYGNVLGQSTDQASTPTEGTAPRVYLKNLTMSPGTLAGPYAVACNLAVDTKHQTTGGIYSYRSEEVTTSPSNATSQSMTAAVCAPATPNNMNGKSTAAPAAPTFRYFYSKSTNNGLQNLGTGSAPVDCPMPNFVDNGIARHVVVYITETSSTAAGSTCHLAARTPYYTNDVLASDPNMTKTTSTGASQRSLDFVDSNTSYVDPLGYSVECTLKPGATLNSIRFGSF